MEKSFNVHPRHLPRKEREQAAVVTPRSHRQKASKASRPHNTSASKESAQKEKPETDEMMSDQRTEVRLKSTVVDIDSVRDDKVKEENLGLLEAAEQEDGLKHKNLGVFEWLLMVFVLALVLLFLPFSIWFCVKV